MEANKMQATITTEDGTSTSTATADGFTECDNCGTQNHSTREVCYKCAAILPASTPELSPALAAHLAAAPSTPASNASALIDGAALARTLKTVKPFVANRTTLPVLSNVLVETSPDGESIRFTATNLEAGIRVRVPGIADGSLAITVPHKLWCDTAPSTGDVLLTQDVRTRTLSTEQGKTRTNYKGIAAEEYPIIPDVSPGDYVCSVPRAILQRVINEVVDCASTDDSRPQLAGVYMELAPDGGLTFAAADGFRLARLEAHITDGTEQSPADGAKYIIPARSVALLGALDSESVAVYVTPSGNAIHFIGDTVEITSRLVEGNYVDIKRVIPTDWGTRIVLAVDSLAAACKALKPFAKDSANIMRLQIADGVLTASANAAEVGDRMVEIDTAGIDGESGQVALNLLFVADMLAAVKGATIAMETKTYQSPAVFRVGTDLLYVIMPMYLPNR
jgi:DNA polymerase-3 subunit beta